jgi:neutral ceramidase
VRGRVRKVVWLVSGIALTLFAQAAPAQVPGLLAGAAKVDITPPPAEMAAPFNSVADPIFVRALVIESAGKRAVFVIADVPTIGADVAAELTARITQLAHSPSETVMLGTTHTHNAMRVAHNAVGIILPGSSKFVERVSAAVLLAVEQAEARMVPARMGIGKGKVALTGNRNVWSPAHGRVISDVDRTGKEPVDHALGVVKFEALDGKPIAFLLNHGFEPVVAMPLKGEISGDVPGVAARVIEERVGHDAVALFTIGAAGVPLYRADDSPEHGRRAHAISLMTSIGTIFAEEALTVAQGLTMESGPVPISGRAKPLICPGKATTPFNLPDRCAYASGRKLPACTFVDRDADRVKLNIGTMKIGGLSLVQTDANVTPALGLKLQRRAPVPTPWIVALTFGPMRFVVNDSAYAQNTYEATATTAKRGCAESGYLAAGRAMLVDQK